LKSSNLIAQLTATLAGAGLCILPRFIADRAAHLMPVLGHDVRITRSFWLIVHEDLRALARVAATADFIAETVLRRQAEFLPD
jgi:DNA-binding transcriptional LysR family regulator